ncbi:DUF1150 family protein [Celeribacter halophilus]|uniref:DUF1150 family protein n=1 Tax=Celeribacter halophilus TaxID=576117 RepID=UPI002FD3EFCD
MNTRYSKAPFSDDAQTVRIAYVRPIAVSDLPKEVQAQAEGLEKIYSLNDAEGTQLALVANRPLAFALAREHDFAPVNVH